MAATVTKATVGEFLLQPRHGRDERRHAGKALRTDVPRADHAALPEAAGRADPVDLLREQEASREPGLLGLRYARMAVDPFAFLRGAAAVMAADLADLPRTTLESQLCGDAHLANVGMFASPDRRLVLDVNDFDETLSGPFEWDVKRLAASVAVAGRVNGLKDKQVRRAVSGMSAAYRETMRALAASSTLAVWYTRFDVEPMLARLRGSALGGEAKAASRKAWRNTGDVAVAKLTEVTPQGRRFRNDPPLLVRVDEAEHPGVTEHLTKAFTGYLETLPQDRTVLLLRYRLVDVAHKVVGVGSVGTRALVLLLEAGDGEPLILQMKQAGPSVLERYLHRSRFRHSGQRVVVGQHLMQATSDPFLGWTSGSDGTKYYLRQLRDMKGSIDASRLDGPQLATYGQLCGAVLARAHARSGDPSQITGYLGGSEVFDQALADFAMGYADITEADHARLVAARTAGEVPGWHGPVA